MDTSPTESYAPDNIKMQPEYLDTPMNNVVTELHMDANPTEIYVPDNIEMQPEYFNTPMNNVVIEPHMDTNLTESFASDNIEMQSEYFDTPMNNVVIVPHMDTNPAESYAPDNIEMQPEYFDTPMTNVVTEPTKRRKLSSVIWEDFTLKEVGDGYTRAACMNCTRDFAYITDFKHVGTSHIKRHIEYHKSLSKMSVDSTGLIKQTPRRPSKTASVPVASDSAGPIKLTPKRRPKTASVPVAFDSDRLHHEIAQMIILHGYPRHMVEHKEFMAFLHNLQPKFNLVDFSTVQDECVATYLSERSTIGNLIEQMPGRICLTLDLWNSNNTTGYIFIRGQFTDREWNIHKRLLKVVMEPYPESDSAFTNAVSACLSDWNIKGRLFSVTLNHNQPLSEIGINGLRSLLSRKTPSILNGQLLLTNCLARSLTSIVQEALQVCEETVKKVRNCVKYVKTSEPIEDYFLGLKQQLNVLNTRNLSLDDQTKWNTTYEMLLAASELKNVFSCLDTSDADNLKSPSREEWKVVDNICTYLTLIFDTASLLASSSVSPANTFFEKVWKLQVELTCASTSEDNIISTITKPMQKGFDKYWKSSCLVLAIAVVMDPRFKMKYVEFIFPNIFGDEAVSYINIVDEGIHGLFLEYATGYVPGHSSNGVGLTEFDAFIIKSRSQQLKSELDQYLEESVLPNIEFDIMGWWKFNESKYPILSKMARDILSLPVSTVDPESVFDTRVKEMDRYHCTLRPEMVEALYCAKDWLSSEPIKSMESLLKMEFPI